MSETEIPLVKVIIDGQELEVPQGVMIIEAADKAGITIPRFCYHKKLSVAANCRMCLVEVENGRKPMPACASPVSDGMKVFTKSKQAIAYQKAVMEFLLINHPLDCPICDQGGECELQDMAMGYGQDVSRYNQGKRVVEDHDIGPLISTDLTRCIHCTRCVRFGIEIAGLREMGMAGRGEHSHISTFLHQSVDSEMSGNVIDLCPVGALTSKPFRYQARAWEMQQFPTVAPHDCVGSNLYLHVRRNEVMRAVPRENETLNEVWIADRDRFSYQALQSDQRLTQPMIKRDGEWETVDWSEAFEHIIKQFDRIKDKHGVSAFGALASPNSTTEELYLLQKLFRGFDCSNIDHRMRQHDFSHQNWQAQIPGLDCSLQEIEDADVIWGLGGDFRRDHPIVHHRIRQATHHAAEICITNPIDFDLRFKETIKQLVNFDDLVLAAASVLKAVLKQTKQQNTVSESMVAMVNEVADDPLSEQIADKLLKTDHPIILGGLLAANHPQAAILDAIMCMIKQLVNAKGGQLTEGANSAGAWLAGAVPHRGVAGEKVKKGLNAAEMLQHDKIRAFLLLNTEPEFDSAYGIEATRSLSAAECVVALTPFVGKGLQQYADVMLPIAAFSETSGTYINALGHWQSFQGVVTPAGQARPAWKVIRVLANFMELGGFEYLSTADILAEIEMNHQNSDFKPEVWKAPKALPKPQRVSKRVSVVPMYATDGLVRRADALQQTQLAQLQSVVKVSPAVASKHKLNDGDKVSFRQKEGDSVVLVVSIDPLLPDKNIVVPMGIEQTLTLSKAFDRVMMEKV